MTHPLTPREKVRQIIDGALNSAIPEPWEVANHATDAILTALASGSGDHAELAELREHRIAADLLVSSLKSDKAEVERKLAEAVGLLGDVVFVRKDNAGRSAEYMLSEVITKVRTFISKEAERG